MITQPQIAAAVERLAQAAQPERILVFGSHARGEAREESDLDLLVIETEVPDRAAEMVRLRRLLRPLRIPVDILVYSRAEVERWGNQPGCALFWALREGRVVYARSCWTFCKPHRSYRIGDRSVTDKKSDNPELAPPTLQAVRLFLGRVSARYAVSGAYLFGSRARGDFHADSDADVAVLLSGARVDFLDTKLDLSDVAYDVLLETGIRIQPLPIWDAEWTHPESYSNPRLLTNISREGIRL